jgi:hypothetical protein
MIAQRMSQVEQELLTFSKYLSTPSHFSGVRLSQALVFCGVFSRALFVLLSFLYYIILVGFAFLKL